MAGRAAIYARISNDREGRELGVERQREDCRKLADQLGYGDVTVFTDNDVSASTLSAKPRPEFARMMKLAAEGEFEAIIAYSNSRLTRRVVEIQAIIDVVRGGRLRVHTVASGQHDLDTADGRAAMLTIAVWDQAEAERTAERIRRMKAEHAKNGERSGGAIPYGYRDANGLERGPDTTLPNGRVLKGKLLRKVVLVPDPQESAVVGEAAGRIIAGDTLHSIVTDWNGQGRLTRGGKHWRQTNLRSILMNRSLLGQTKAGVQSWEPTLTEADFDRLQRVFNDPSRKVTHSPGLRGGKYSMGAVTHCAACGGKLTTHGRAGSSGVRLACLSRINGPSPKHPKDPATGRDTGRVTVDHDRLERYVFETIERWISESDDWQRELAARPAVDEGRIRALEARKADVIEQQARVNDLLKLGKRQFDYVARETEANDRELDAIDRELDSMKEAPTLDVSPDTFKWREWSADRRRNFLRLARLRVVVAPWPKDVPARTVGRLRDEADQSYGERVEAFHRKVMERRVTIKRAPSMTVAGKGTTV